MVDTDIEVTFNQKFYTIESCGFRQLDTKEYVFYNDVIPVYVYSKNLIHDGTVSFDICPVDLSTLIGTNSYKWRRSCFYGDIGLIIFNTKAECVNHYNKKYTSTEKNTDKFKKRIKFLQEYTK